MSVARALWLLEWLPEGAALHASIQGGPEFRPWTLATTLQAGSLNALNGANWQRAGGKGKKPQPVSPPTKKKRVAGASRPGHEGAQAAKDARRRAITASRVEVTSGDRSDHEEVS